ncbi:cysteine desulfurase [Cellulomonas bogoriensis 69B4 = DSM 16987]|uniref:Cysteine desulfurase n=1 Tax=Cellulomonas bogoriensis 69B4 = DSM 16987 TaxID=1386082 RepID=A0A0A0BW41_9CELL|nr:cysteine desulfurase [Cellulomonas bogoriensis 69B4 = DSM 16987]
MAGDAIDVTLADLHDWHAELRAQFPILTANPHTAYLDSSATAQKPQAVLDAVHHYLTTTNANAGRGTYPWATTTTAQVEATAERIKEHLHDPDPATSTVHLVPGTSAGLRAVATDWLTGWLTDGDEIIVPFADHQANAQPWLEAQQLLARRGIRITVHELPYETASGDYDDVALAAMVTDRTRLVAVTHVHHVYGAHMNVDRIRRAVGPDVVVCLDAAQSVGHMPVSVAGLDVDVLVFSGHKAMALPGVGAVWCRGTRAPAFAPAGWPGSPNTVGAVSLCAALSWLDQAGLDRIDRWTVALGARLTDALHHLDGFEVLGCQASLAATSTVQRRQGIVSFRHHTIDAADLGFILTDHGLLVRADHHCQAGAGERDGSVRVSTHAYTAVDEIDHLIHVLTDLDRGAYR